jgi:hypothetical protein
MQVILIFVSAITFIFYGLLCLLTDHMKGEFRRYGLSEFRILTGVLEVLGGAGQLIGLVFSPLLFLSSGGLALLMLLGMIVRLKTKDPLIQIIPAFGLMVMNLMILGLIL